MRQPVVLPLTFRRDISFWVEEGDESSVMLTEFLQRLCGDDIKFSLENFDDGYRCPTTGRRALGFHVDLWSPTKAMTKHSVNRLFESINRKLAEGLNIAYEKMLSDGSGPDAPLAAVSS